MSNGPQFVDDGVVDEAGSGDDVLDTVRPGPQWYARTAAVLRRHPALDRAGRVIVFGAVAVAATLAVVPHHPTVAGHGSALAEVQTQPSGPSAPSTVRGLVATAGPLADYVRQTAAAGACPTVPVGTSATRAITRQVRAALPEFRITDVASTLDEFTGLCSVRLRARAAHGVVLALVVSAPAPGTPRSALAFVRLQVGTDTAADGSATVWVAGTTEQRWSIVVGVVGVPDALPSSATLQRLVQQDDLTW